MENISNLTTEELYKMRDAVNILIAEHEAEARKNAEAKFKALIKQVNEMQSKYDFSVRAFDMEDGYEVEIEDLRVI